jgi:hypothetical protein
VRNWHRLFREILDALPPAPSVEESVAGVRQPAGGEEPVR